MKEGREPTKIDLAVKAFLESKIPLESSDRNKGIQFLAEKAGVGLKMMQFVFNDVRCLSKKAQEKLAAHFGITHMEMIDEGERLLRGGDMADRYVLSEEVQGLLRMATEVLISDSPHSETLAGVIKMSHTALTGGCSTSKIPPLNPPKQNHA